MCGEVSERGTAEGAVAGEASADLQAACHCGPSPGEPSSRAPGWTVAEPQGLGTLCRPISRRDVRAFCETDATRNSPLRR